MLQLNKKGENMYKAISIIFGIIFTVFLLICTVFLHKIAYRPNQPDCGGVNALFVRNSIEEWVQDGQKQKIVVTSVSGYQKFLRSPLRLGTTLYNELENGSICSASVSVAIEDPKDGTKKNLGDIDVRYQLISASEGGHVTNILMAGPDVQDMKEKLMNLVRAKK